MVRNGYVLECNQLCPSATLHIQNHTFIITLRFLPISGADVILGIEWLKLLGPITTNYTSFTMHFTHLGQQVAICVDVHNDPSPASAHQVKRMIHTNCTSTLFHLSLLPESFPDPTTSTIHPIFAIESIILKFNSIFQPPVSLSPPRHTVHHINFLPFANLINVHPYRFPYFQKSKIEK